MIGLLDHVNFQAALSTLGDRVEHGLKRAGQVPQVRGGHDFCRHISCCQLLLQPFRLVMVHLVAGGFTISKSGTNIGDYMRRTKDNGQRRPDFAWYQLEQLSEIGERFLFSHKFGRCRSTFDQG